MGRKIDLESILHCLDEAVFACDTTKQIVYTNPGVEYLTGVDAETASTLTCCELLGNYRQLCQERCPVEDVLSGAATCVEREGALYTAAGEQVDIHLSIRPIFRGGTIRGAVAVLRDISCRKQAERRLRESENRYRMIFNHSALGIMHFNRSGIITDCNQSFCNIMGADRDTIVGMNMLHTLTDEKMLSAIRLALSGQTGFYEGTYRSVSGGKNIPVRAVFSQIKSDTGHFEGAICITENITERVQAEEKRRETEERYRQMIECQGEGLALVDLDERFLLVNPVGEEIFGVPVGTLAGRSLRDFTSTESFEFLQQQTDLRRKGKRSSYDLEIIREDGQVRSLRITATPWLDDSGILRGAFGIFRDETEHLNAQKALAAEKERLAVTLRSIGEGVITTDLEGHIVLMNPVAEKLTGWTLGEATGRPLQNVLQVMDPESRHPGPDLIELALSGDASTVIPSQLVIMTRQGEQKHVSDTVTPILNTENRAVGTVVVIRDITAQRRMEEEIRKVQRLESLARLAGGIAHDFNNVLLAVMGNIDLAKLMTRREDPLYEILAETETAAHRARQLTRQLLGFARGGELARSEIKLETLVRQALAPALAASDMRCELSFSPDLWPVTVDEEQMTQVIQNLALYAASTESMPYPLSLGATNIPLGAAPPPVLSTRPYVRLRLVIPGLVLPDRDRSRFFDPYFTSGSTGGLDLAVAYSIVRRHEGHMEVHSIPQAGTGIDIYLPAIGSVASDREQTIPRAAPPRGSGRVLLMDDDRLVRQVAQRMLSQLGYDCTLATDGREVLQLYHEAMESNSPFNAVILDLVVAEGMGGEDTVARLLEMDPQARVVLSTGLSNAPIMAEYRQHGFREIAIKPYHIEDLATLMQRILSGEPEDD